MTPVTPTRALTDGMADTVISGSAGDLVGHFPIKLITDLRYKECFFFKCFLERNTDGTLNVTYLSIWDNMVIESNFAN